MSFLFSLMVSAFAMPPNQLDNLTNRIEDASFSSDKLLIIQNLPSNTKLSCAEAVQILNALSFPADKKSAVNMILPYLTDLENRHMVIAAFTFHSDKQEIGTLLDTEHAKRVEAESLQQAREHQENRNKHASDQKMAEKEKQLNIWEQRLQQWEEKLKQREMILNSKEAELQKEAQRLAKLQKDLQLNQHSNTSTKESSSSVQWVGYCPQGLDKHHAAIGECLPFNTAHFNPLVNNGQQLFLQVAKPGTVELKMELGPETQNCKSTSKITSIQTKKIAVQYPNQIIDVGALVDNWYRESIRITAQSSGYGESLYLEDWQNCQ